MPCPCPPAIYRSLTHSLRTDLEATPLRAAQALRGARLARALLVLGLLLAAGCRPAPAASPRLDVFAAASLGGAFGALGARFEADHPGLSVSLNLAGSNQLAQQLADGAPADVFASAAPEQMAAAVAAGRVAEGAVQPFATNRLVVVYPAANPAGLATLADLARPGLRLVLAAPEVPAGRYALEFLDRAAQDPAYGPEYRARVLANVVSYEQNVRAAFGKAALGEADAAIVYGSDAAGAADVGQLTIPAALNVVATYPIAPITNSSQPKLAQAFIDFVLSDEGQAVLASYGFGRK